MVAPIAGSLSPSIHTEALVPGVPHSQGPVRDPAPLEVISGKVYLAGLGVTPKENRMN